MRNWCSRIHDLRYGGSLDGPDSGLRDVVYTLTVPALYLLGIPQLTSDMAKIYVASSWRNKYQPEVVAALRAAGHEVYDFRNPEHNPGGFHWADTCVLVLPCGRSAHTEAGWFAGKGLKTIVYMPEKQEPELMYKLFDGVVDNLNDLLRII